MSRLGLAFCLWVVYVHAAPGYGGRDHGGDSSGTVVEQRKLTSVALPISHINNAGRTEAGYVAGRDGDKGSSGGGVNYGDHSNGNENSDDRGSKDAGGREDTNGHSSSESGRDNVKEQSGTGQENVNHSSGSGHGSNIDRTNEGNSNFGGNGKGDNDRIIGDVSEKTSGNNGGYIENSNVKDNSHGPGNEGTDSLKVNNEKSIKEGLGGEDSVLNDESRNDKSDSGSTKGSENSAGGSYLGGTSVDKSKHHSSTKDVKADEASFSGVSGGGKDSTDEKDYISSSHGSENGSGGYHSNTAGNGQSEQQGGGNEGADQSSLSAGDKDTNAKKDDMSSYHGSEKYTSDYNGATSKEKGEHQESNGHGNVHTGEKKDQGKSDDNNRNTDGIGSGKQTEEVKNYDGGNGYTHDGHSSGSHMY